MSALRGWYRRTLVRWKDDLRYTAHLMRNSPLAMAGAIIVIVVVVMAVMAPLIAPYGPEERDYDLKLQPPTIQHLFGTDDRGGDVFSRVLFGYRIDLAISSSVVILAATIGSVCGLVAGFVSGKFDEAIMRITDIFLAIPSLILAMAIGAVLGRTPENLAMALAFTWWPVYARLARGQVLIEKRKLYVDGARAAGTGPVRVLFKHILPNSIYPVIVNATLDLGAVILTVAALSFLGFGVQPGAAELGRMTSDGRAYVFASPWVVAAPGLAILVVALGLNLLGDAVRDFLDPRLRR